MHFTQTYRFFPLLLAGLTLIMLSLPTSVRAQNSFEDVASYIVVEANTRIIFASKDATKKRQIASLTKIATALVALDWVDITQTKLDSLVRVPRSADSLVGPNPLQLRSGDQLTVRDAIFAALLISDNRAAETLATHVGQDLRGRLSMEGSSVEVFISQMNSLAAKLGMERTSFLNAHGLDGPNIRPYSTAQDLAKLTVHALSKPGFRFYVAQKERDINVIRQGKSRSFRVQNTNRLLGVMEIDGVKTGLTKRAGQCLALSSTRPTDVQKLGEKSVRIVNKRLVVIVLGAQDRFRAGQQLVQFGWREYENWLRNRTPVERENIL